MSKVCLALRCFKNIGAKNEKRKVLLRLAAWLRVYATRSQCPWMVLAGWHETLACRWISGQYVMSQKASKSNSQNSLYKPILATELVAFLLNLHQDSDARRCHHQGFVAHTRSKTLPLQAPPKGFCPRVGWTKKLHVNPLQCPFLSNQTCLFYMKNGDINTKTGGYFQTVVRIIVACLCFAPRGLQRYFWAPLSSLLLQSGNCLSPSTSEEVSKNRWKWGRKGVQSGEVSHNILNIHNMMGPLALVHRAGDWSSFVKDCKWFLQASFSCVHCIRSQTRGHHRSPVCFLKAIPSKGRCIRDDLAWCLQLLCPKPLPQFAAGERGRARCRNQSLRMRRVSVVCGEGRNGNPEAFSWKLNASC